MDCSCDGTFGLAIGYHLRAPTSTPIREITEDKQSRAKLIPQNGLSMCVTTCTVTSYLQLQEQTLSKLRTFAPFWIISRDKRFASQQKYFPRNKRGQRTLAKFIFLRPAKKFVCQLFLAVILDLTKFYQTHRFMKIC